MLVREADISMFSHDSAVWESYLEKGDICFFTWWHL